MVDLGISETSSGQPGMIDRTTRRWVFLLLVVCGGLWGTAALHVLGSSGNANVVTYTLLVGFFLLGALAYLTLHGLKSLSWFSAPVLATIYYMVAFVALPSLRFVRGDEVMDAEYVKAMMLVAIGMPAYWLGSLLMLRPGYLRFRPTATKTPLRVSGMCGAAVLAGAGAKTLMWKFGIFSYLADQSALVASLWYIQWLTYLASFLNAGLIVAAIEVFGKRKPGPLITTLFWIALLSALLFGLISGFKGELLMPILLLVLIYAITHQRLPKSALLLPLLPILVYPFGDAYRHNVDAGGGRDRATTVDGLVEVLVKSFTDVVTGNTKVLDEGATKTSYRLSDLGYVHDMLQVKDPALLKGEEKVWLAPFYPIVPRVLWPTKPIFNKSVRLSIALGRPETMASAVPLLGDLYLMNGIWAVLAGLFCYGIAYQIYMNWSTKHALSERRLFFYTLMMVQLLSLGGDIVGSIANWVQQAIVYTVVAYVIYGAAKPDHPSTVSVGVALSPTSQPAGSAS